MPYTYETLDVARQIGNTLTGAVQFVTTSAVQLGGAAGTPAASMSYDGTNVVLDPKVTGSGIVSLNGGNLQFEQAAIGSKAISATAVIFGNGISSAAYTQLWAANLTHTGGGGSLRALAFTITGNGTEPSPALVSFCIANLAANITQAGGTTTPNSTGFQGQAGCATNAQTVGAGQTKNITLNGVVGLAAGDSLAHSGTGGTLAFFRTGVRAVEPSALSAITGGATDTAWAFRSEGDAQIHSDKKLILEGSDTVKGDSYLIFNSASTDIDLFVDNTNVMTLDNDRIDVKAVPLRFNAIAAPSAVAGDVWTDSTQGALTIRQSGVTQSVVGCTFTQTANATVSNTATETTLVGTGIGTATLAGNFLKVGKTIRIRAAGIYSTQTVPVTLNMRVKLTGTGGATIFATGDQTPGGLLTNRAWSIDCEITCRTTGATGTVVGQSFGGFIHFSTATTPQSWEMLNAAAVTIDTTASQPIDVTADWGVGVAAADSITMTNLSVEVLN